MMEDEKKSREMSEEELDQISGGDGFDGGGGPPTTETRVIRRDSKGNPTHWQVYIYEEGTPLSKPYHYVCPHCGRLLHEGAFWRLYCDPCDEGWFRGSLPEKCKRAGIYPGC